jgi:hypothetical protein
LTPHLALLRALFSRQVWSIQFGTATLVTYHWNSFTRLRNANWSIWAWKTLLESSSLDHGRKGSWNRRGGSREWFTSARSLRCEWSLPLPQDCPQYVP